MSDGSLDDLGDELLVTILSFVPSVRCLSVFARTHKRAFQMIHRSDLCLDSIRRLFRKEYGSDGGRGELRTIHALKLFLARDDGKSGGTRKRSRKKKSANDCHQTVKSNGDNSHRIRSQKIGLLTATQEQEALLYDGGDSNPYLSIGYFGFEDLACRNTSGNNVDNNTGPLVVWGDFPGLRIFESVPDMLAKQRKIAFVGYGESHALVLLKGPNQSTDACASSSCFFYVGFASGNVWKIRAEPGKDGCMYRIEETAQQHTGEVTSLCFLPSCSNGPQHEREDLLSAAMDGNVYKYTNGCLSDAIPYINVSSPVLCMSSIEYQGQRFVVTGDRDGYVSLWWKYLETDEDWYCSYVAPHFEGVLTDVLLLVGKKKTLYAVTGTNAGELTTWQVDEHQELELVGSDKSLRGTPIESMKLFGTWLLVCAGNRVRVFDPPSPQGIARHAADLPSLPDAGSTLGFLMDHSKQTIMTLSRNGTLQEWSFGHEPRFSIQEKKRRKEEPAAVVSSKRHRRRRRRRRVYNKKDPPAARKGEMACLEENSDATKSQNDASGTNEVEATKDEKETG